jgi:ribonucleoside-diphosphate reductase alpha chain
MRVPSQRQTFQRHDGHMTVVTIGGEQLRLAAGRRADGALGEVSISWGRHGSTAAGLLEGYAAALSLGLGHGVPLADLLRPGLGLRFTPDGRTDDPDIPRTSSAVDYCCRRLAIDWLPYAQRAALGVITPAEHSGHAPGQGRAGGPRPAASAAMTLPARGRVTAGSPGGRR